MLFCFKCECFPISSFVISVGGSVSNWGESCLCGNDDGEMVRGEGFSHFPRCYGGEVWGAEGDVRGSYMEMSLVRRVGMLVNVVEYCPGVELSLYFVSSVCVWVVCIPGRCMGVEVTTQDGVGHVGNVV